MISAAPHATLRLRYPRLCAPRAQASQAPLLPRHHLAVELFHRGDRARGISRAGNYEPRDAPAGELIDQLDGQRSVQARAERDFQRRRAVLRAFMTAQPRDQVARVREGSRRSHIIHRPVERRRRSEGSVCPPKTIGGRGCWIGLGMNLMPSTCTVRPAKVGSLRVHSWFIRARYSRVRRARSANDIPTASNSSSSHPIPTPKMKRPPGKHVEARNRLGGRERIAQRHDKDSGRKPDTAGDGGGIRERHQRIVQRRIGRRGQPAALRVRVARSILDRQNGVLRGSTATRNPVPRPCVQHGRRRGLQSDKGTSRISPVHLAHPMRPLATAALPVHGHERYDPAARERDGTLRGVVRLRGDARSARARL